MNVSFNEASWRHPVSHLLDNDQATQLLKMAFDHGGYVAGGFGRLMAKCAYEGFFNFSTRFNDYFGTMDIMSNMMYPKIGDIDVFFNDEDKMYAFLGKLPSIRFYNPDSVNANSAFVSYDAGKKIRVQFIMRYVGPMEAVLNEFDIYNAMVGFNDRKIIIPEGWYDLERSNVLHVVKAESPLVVHRVAKWLTKHGYNHLTPGSRELITRICMEALATFKDGKEQIKIETMDEKHYDFTVYSFVNKLQPVLNTLTGEQLLRLAALYPKNVYSREHTKFPMDVMFDRMKMQDSGASR